MRHKGPESEQVRDARRTALAIAEMDMSREWPAEPWKLNMVEETTRGETKAYIGVERPYPHGYSFIEVRERYVGQAESTAKHIVACVNACAGLDTAYLEQLGNGGIAKALAGQ